MLHDDASLSPLTQIEAKIQSRIAKFLMLKETLLGLAKNDSVIISERAKSLLGVQGNLETQLAAVLGNIEKFKQGSWTFSDVADITSFYYSMEQQLKNVGDLSNQASGVVSSGGDWVSWLPYVFILGVPAIILYGATKKRRR